MRQAGRVFLRDISGEFSVPLFQPHAYPLPGRSYLVGVVYGLQNATAGIDIGSCGHRVTPSHRGLWLELNEDHAVAASYHDATLASVNIEHHISARHLSSVCRLHRDKHRSPCSAACRDWRGTSAGESPRTKVIWGGWRFGPGADSGLLVGGPGRVRG